MQKCDKCNGAGVTGLEAGAWGQQSVAIGPQKPDAIGPAVPTGSTAFIFEIAALNADNDRLRRELGAAKAELERLKKCLEKANANAENFEREWYLRGDALESAQSELARMRPVVEAANAWFDSAPGDDSDRCMIAIVNAVLAYRDGAGKGGQ